MALYSTYTDGDLVTLLEKDDEKAFTEIYLRYREQLSAYAFNFSGNREDALDVVQDLFAALWNLRNQLTITHSLKAYLYQGVRNGCLGKVEKMKKSATILKNLAAAFEIQNQSSLDDQIDANETSRQVNAVISSLPDKMQQVFRLSREEGMTHAEISKELDISPHTVKTQVQNALKLIRSRLGKISGSLVLIISHILK